MEDGKIIDILDTENGRKTKKKLKEWTKWKNQSEMSMFVCLSLCVWVLHRRLCSCHFGLRHLCYQWMHAIQSRCISALLSVVSCSIFHLFWQFCHCRVVYTECTCFNLCVAVWCHFALWSSHFFIFVIKFSYVVIPLFHFWYTVHNVFTWLNISKSKKNISGWIEYFILNTQLYYTYIVLISIYIQINSKPW